MQELLYPMKLVGRPVNRVWGVTDTTSLLGYNIESSDPIGEVWTLGDWEDGDRVLNGPHEGKTITSLVEEIGVKQMFGTAGLTKSKRTPLLVKWIAASTDLSIQVHPDEETALKVGSGAEPKTECWYILDTDPGGAVIYGVRTGVPAEKVGELARNGQLEAVINKIEVHPGDVVFVPAGMVHAICAGVRLLEVQQNSDTTYRLYDYNRPGLDGKPRPLHVDQAVRSIKPCDEKPALNPVIELPFSGGVRKFRAACRHFLLEEVHVREATTLNLSYGSFMFSSIIRGTGVFEAGGRRVEVSVPDNIFLPAGLSEVKIEPGETISFVASSVPRLKQDVIEPLREGGFSDRVIISLGGNVFGNDLVPLVY
ncbi:MAG: hypothetical protein GXP49_07295 [Deltaproteobacteria bacterium]|nr:hypothetical protein [Deltaproteobacteria bacterium]